MRRIQAIALVLALLTAPLALLANSASIARYEKQLSMTAQDDHCSSADVLGICGCHPGSAPVPVIISPLPETILLHPISLPALESRMPEVVAPAVVVLSEFVPPPFHPPRG